MFSRAHCTFCFYSCECLLWLTPWQAQLSSLFDLTEKQNRRKNELEIELANYRHLNTLDETLELQVSISTA